MRKGLFVEVRIPREKGFRFIRFRRVIFEPFLKIFSVYNSKHYKKKNKAKA